MTVLRSFSPTLSRRLSWLSVFLILLQVGCDQAPGVVPPVGNPPVLSDFSFEPSNVFAGGGFTEVDGQLRVPLTMSVTVSDPDADLETVSFVVQSPVSSRDPIASGNLAHVGDGRYERTAEVMIPRAEVGVYTVLVYAVDQSGSISNNVRGMLRFTATGEPPVILEVAAPDTVVRPAAGGPAKLIRIVASVSDPDGLTNINVVQFWNADNPSAKFPMFDDGDTAASG
ncbi:MAG: hypothetical protein WD275_08145, partial [Rhodothermales bacterium]